MHIDNITNLIKKKGFLDTVKILASAKGFKLKKKEFYAELKKFSYHNSFYRIKNEMLNSGLLTVSQNNGQAEFALTRKCLCLLSKLTESEFLLLADVDIELIN
jgi:hypothetical protein